MSTNNQQVAGPSTVAPTFTGVTTVTAPVTANNIGQYISGLGTSAYVITGAPLQGFKPVRRRARQPKQVPTFTPYLEERLNKCLGKNAKRMVRSLSKKCKTPPIITVDGEGNSIYSFKSVIVYYVQPLPFHAFSQADDDVSLVPVPRRTTCSFDVSLTLDRDENLKNYAFSMKAQV